MSKLIVIWTTNNKALVVNMLVLYAVNSKMRGKYKEINVIVKGILAKQLVLDDSQVQREVLRMMNLGIDVNAGMACNDALEVTERLGRLGIETIYINKSLTDYNKKIIDI